MRSLNVSHRLGLGRAKVEQSNFKGETRERQSCLWDTL